MSDISPREGARDRMRDHMMRDHMMASSMSSERIEGDENVWTRRLVLFLRVMAVLSIIKGLYHWAQVTGFVGGEDDAFENQPMAWQAATVYFAVIELVAAVGLWLATPWGAVVWLTTVVSMAVIELMFPGIYGGSLLVVGGEAVMLAAYLALAWMAARERPP
ncbi:MAG TPA: DUF6163 family protein [Bradyrhizobium sp.]|uniref:DUF6163 family protein n=1 Tax=Bradyrhizobium sp. TaxID=376 RepID=UPI002CD3B8DE|nr:DUF6163 family protein [Bradyrhizobium sp.]HLZ01780.1 DUF6163 family protein [Bradyrhizobium sp.]